MAQNRNVWPRTVSQKVQNITRCNFSFKSVMSDNHRTLLLINFCILYIYTYAVSGKIRCHNNVCFWLCQMLRDFNDEFTKNLPPS